MCVGIQNDQLLKTAAPHKKLLLELSGIRYGELIRFPQETQELWLKITIIDWYKSLYF
jgi:hypothetical protein